MIIESENLSYPVAKIIEINKLLFTPPETKSQGLFHQIQKEVTFCGLPHGADA